METKEFLHFSPLRSVGNSRDQAGLPQDMWTCRLGNLGSIAATMTTVNVVYKPNLIKHAGFHQKCPWMFIPLYCWVNLSHYHYDLCSLQQSSWLMITDSYMTSHTYIYLYTHMCMYVCKLCIYWRLSQSMN